MKKKTIPKRFIWILKIIVDKTWVADGFNLTEDRAIEMLRNDLRHAKESEVGVKILEAPDDEFIAKAMGYHNVENWREDNK